MPLVFFTRVFSVPRCVLFLPTDQAGAALGFGKSLDEVKKGKDGVSDKPKKIGF